MRRHNQTLRVTLFYFPFPLNEETLNTFTYFCFPKRMKSVHCAVIVDWKWSMFQSYEK